MLRSNVTFPVSANVNTWRDPTDMARLRMGREGWKPELRSELDEPEA